ncbi:unnamed protein product [Brassicogethes aeneus]|uniref:Major facilitator superfamily (MFS) profile domain-containing protein n=1 Tax=Brassicogethes aeneus TaxID=1431903 RepID=A0A9P0B6R6_BRAAE|nr:unnamed protein product [Brassicogethes aeneus]
MGSFFEKFRGTGPQLIAAFTSTFFALSDGMHYGWTAPAISKLTHPNSPVQTTIRQAELLETVLMFGAFCGLPLTIYFPNKIGRKYSLLLASSFSLTGWMLIALANHIYVVFIARFFAGLAGDMAFVAAPMYIAEIADQKIRGFLSSFIYLMMLTGIIMVYCITPFTPLYVPPIIGGSFVLLELIIFPFMPESPYYLLTKDKREEARSALLRLRNTENIDKEFETIESALARQKTETGRPQDLFLVPSNRKALLIMSVLNAAQHFSSISVMLMNLHSILASAGSTYIEDSTAAILFSLVMLTSALCSSLLMDKFGRKALLINSSILTGLTLLIIATYFQFKVSGSNMDSISWIPVATVMLYAACFKSGLGLVPIVLTAELFPAKLKSFGMTLADASYVVWAIISLLVYQLLHDRFGMHVPFFVYAISCFGTAIFTYFVIPETMGKTLDEIQYILKGKVPPPKGDLKADAI